jgi:type II secretory pathway pseudopilin PulG
VEIMIVVVIIGLLAAMAIPAFQRVRERSRISRVANDLRIYAQVFNTYALENGAWPPNASPGEIPVGLEGQLKVDWTQPTALGGHWTWANWPAPDNLKMITIFEAFESVNQLAQLDKMIDDGDPNTGSFRLVNAHYSLILEGTPP